MLNCIEIVNSYVLQYIIEPNKFIYFICDDKDKLKCSETKFFAYHFVSRNGALREQDKIKTKYNLEFQIVEV